MWNSGTSAPRVHKGDPTKSLKLRITSAIVTEMYSTSSSLPPPGDVPDAGPSKRARIARQACEPCRAGKRKCDGMHPCSYCVNSGRDCVFSDQRRRVNRVNPRPSAQTDHSRVTADTQPAPIKHTAYESPTDQRPHPGLSPATAVSDDNTLARIVHVMTNGRVSRYPSPGQEQSPTGAEPTTPSKPEADLLDRLHRHLTLVFSLRSFPKGHIGENEDEPDIDDVSTFFLPPRDEGRAYIRCYFDHATSTYRYLYRREIERLIDQFYEDDGSSCNTDDVVLLLMLMAIGCLWTPSWTGASPQTMTRKALRLYKAAKRQLETVSIAQPRLRMVQVHIALAHLHLGMSNFRTAWLAFGTAARISQLLRLHRKSPEGTLPDVDEPRRMAFWSSFMMDRYLALVLGCPVLYDERDVTQNLPYCPSVGSVDESQQDEAQRLIGSLAHIRLSRILGHALRALQSPAEMTDAERSRTVQSLNDELHEWLMNTPTFFHPERPEVPDLGPFAKVSPFFQRQQQAVRSAYHFIKLFIHRSYLLDQFINRLPVEQSPSPKFILSPEINTCVESAMTIARSVSKMGESPGAKGTFWNSAYICFASLTVLLVYLMVYEDAPRRREIEDIIEATMAGHIQLTGSTLREREMILEESRRIADSLKHRKEQIPVGEPVAQWPMPLDDPFAGSATNWDPLWQNTLDMLGLDMNLGMSMNLGLATSTNSILGEPESSTSGFNFDFFQ